MCVDPLNQQIVLTLMAPGRDSEFAEMLDEFRAAGELHVYDGDFSIAWDGYAGFYELLSRMKAGGYPDPTSFQWTHTSLRPMAGSWATFSSAIGYLPNSRKWAAMLGTKFARPAAIAE